MIEMPINVDFTWAEGTSNLIFFPLFLFEVKINIVQNLTTCKSGDEIFKKVLKTPRSTCASEE